VTKVLADHNRVTWSVALGQRRAIRGPMTSSVDRVTAWAKFGEGVEMERLGCEKLALADRIGTEGWGLPAAATFFRSALEHEPAMLDAALHLGRVEMLMNHEEPAAALFARAAASTRPSTVYLAELFAGSIDERRGHFAEAETHYRRAAQVFSPGQASVLALAELLGRTGRAHESSLAIDGLLDRRTRGVVLEPWWTYDRRERVPDLRYLRADVSQ
jgi:tetratricopeptide (TPR) repeat protein